MSPDGKLTATRSEQRGGSMSRSIIVVLFAVVGAALLWFLLKRRS
jgi:hypothetical protein